MPRMPACCPAWLLKTVLGVACLIAIGHVTRQKDSSHASVIDAKQAVADANRIHVSTTDADLLAPSFAGASKVKSILNVRKRLHYGDFVWDEAGVPPGDVWIRVDLSAQLLSVFRSGEEIGTAVIMYGGDAKPTPAGQYSILWKGKDHRSSLYDAKMPHTLRLTGDGISIHGANVRARTATNGCISVPAEFAKLLFAQASVGTPVLILKESRTPPPRAV